MIERTRISNWTCIVLKISSSVNISLKEILYFSIFIISKTQLDRRIAIMDGTTITKMRTGTADAVAAADIVITTIPDRGPIVKAQYIKKARI